MLGGGHAAQRAALGAATQHSFGEGCKALTYGLVLQQRGAALLPPAPTARAPPLMTLSMSPLRLRPAFTCRYVYERLTPDGRKSGFLQLLATQLTSAIWHGLYPGARRDCRLRGCGDACSGCGRACRGKGWGRECGRENSAVTAG